jgi:hypothetical protein
MFININVWELGPVSYVIGRLSQAKTTLRLVNRLNLRLPGKISSWIIPLNQSLLLRFLAVQTTNGFGNRVRLQREA